MTASPDLDSAAGSAKPAAISGNLLLDYYDLLPGAVAACVPDPAPVTTPGAFAPGYELPDLDDQVREYFAAASVSWRPLGEYRGHRIALLDLAQNPGTNTTKTYPSLLIVARAVEFIRRTGQPIMIFSPTSANKGTALRDAVLRAIQTGLVTPEQLRIVVLAPSGGQAKLRSSLLSTDSGLRELNPVLVYDGQEPEGVKALGKEFAGGHAVALRNTFGLHLWYSLDLRNYVVADTARAFFERTAAPTDLADRPRTHVHAVSSAFGMLGYHAGREVLEQAGLATSRTRPATLLVQHLATPDMVLHLLHGSFDRQNMPGYQRDAESGRFTQAVDQRFPAVTDDPAEVLDPTFYSRRPVTSEKMDQIIGCYGGDGIVVSRHECLGRYARLSDWLAGSERPLPPDVNQVREWSLVMAFTGALNAIDRGLVKPDHDIVVHGSGWYTTADYAPLPDEAVVRVSTCDDVAAAVMA
jgi:hypothetical protein